MTATISSSPKLETTEQLSQPPALSGSPIRLALAPTGSTPPLLDGAWWPRSRDLSAELPLLTAVLEVGWFVSEQDEHELLLFSYHVGRWNLLVIPPSTPADTAAWLMTAATDPLGTSSGSRLMGEAARLGAVSEVGRGPR
jgi:hypothetical protein